MGDSELRDRIRAAAPDARRIRGRGRVGALSPGRYADITVFSGDPLTTPAGELRELEVRMTIVGGRVVFPE